MKRAWRAAWFDSGVRQRKAALWRGVEAQHVVSTMRLVDNLDEQRVLEGLIEASKLPLVPGSGTQHYLLFTPFRYRSPIASRFRRAIDPGLWYGAEDLETACAEVAFWKWRFLTASVALAGEALHTEHTLFEAQVRGRCVDLTAAPWDAAANAWKHKSDHSACRDLGAQAHERDVAWIRYASARREHGMCGAVLKPVALSLRDPIVQQTWACKTTRDGAFLQHAGSGAKFEFSARRWAASP